MKKMSRHYIKNWLLELSSVFMRFLIQPPLAFNLAFRLYVVMKKMSMTFLHIHRVNLLIVGLKNHLW